jgi:hypothetical protein
MPAITTNTTGTGGNSINTSKLFSTMKTTPDGRRIRVRKLGQGEVKKLTNRYGESFIHQPMIFM